VSADKKARKEATTETITIITEPFAIHAAGTKHSKNRDFYLKRLLLLLIIIQRYKTEFRLMK
jgi:hypothetical protein